MRTFLRSPSLIIFTVLAWLAVCCISAQAQDEDPPAETFEGLYAEMGAGDNPDTFGGEFGIFGYPSEHLSFRVGIACLASESFEDFFVGGTSGIRVNLFRKGSIITPFVGVGIFGGYSKNKVKADDDGVDNDDDGEVDESGEEDDVIDDVIATIFPEAGFQAWLSQKTRVTFSGKYNLTTEGRETDFWQFNLGMAWLF